MFNCVEKLTNVTQMMLKSRMAVRYSKFRICVLRTSEMETGRVNRHRSDRPAGRVAGRVEILRPAGQAGWKTGRILLSGD